MLLYQYACISMNTYCYTIYHISLKMVWWVFSNANLIVQICLVVHEILANKDFTVTDDLISWLFIVAFVHSTYVQIAIIWGFTAQLSLWKSVYWLWRCKLNEVCDRIEEFGICYSHQSYSYWVYSRDTGCYLYVFSLLINLPLLLSLRLRSF